MTRPSWGTAGSGAQLAPGHGATTTAAWTPPPRHRGVDAAGAFLLLAVHIVLAIGTVMVVGFAGVGLDPCSYRPCGNPIWSTISLCMVLVSAAALPAVDFALIVVRLVKSRAAWAIPLVFSAAHIGVGAVSFTLMAASGPQ
ncbi:MULTISPECIES: hypothetical protein [Mycobacteriaceae]|jgi:hypothetical protein|uniref:Uncharacterized protein n=2 Tax=Mycobacteriaceae TaxID=1762 RepID=A0A1X0JEC0_9MYCO|nr:MULTISPECIES: hypothetical protein [Mycobacteriaceae]KRQ19703.1 hypothetical protein AOT87_20080 [Mycobacteroides sp. H003]KRQ24518.1 hypothetical protein AOT91_21710 [Mycobacteroides sp. H092]KRQ44894.1 hypothetical protein AOT92_04255 [Mycobacteroides sp. H101]KRQ45403.1 hypothetical protein AOT88_20125 [Mycobacteroides sp. H063]KRQ53866.1 hypothetical protein AOT94_26080 [Mycobacteroides sp. HXVII]